MIWEAAPTGKRGRQPDYNGEEDQKTVRGTAFPASAIQTCLTMKVLFGMALRQTTGFVESLLHLIDLDWAVPSTPASAMMPLRRAAQTQSYRPVKTQSRGSLHGGGDRTKRSSARIKTLRLDHLATMVRGQPATGSRAAPNATTAKAASKPGCIV